MELTIHKIKIAPEYFVSIVEGRKKAELRKNDRNYKSGDLLWLSVLGQGELAGEELMAVITHVLPVSEIIEGCEGWVILSIDPKSPQMASEFIIERVRSWQ